MDNDYSLLSIIQMLAKWKKHILIATGITFVIACIGTLLMPNYYESYTVFYAANPILANPTPIGDADELRSIYGTDEDLDRIFTIANSNLVYNHLIDSFNLAEHYNIDDATSKGKKKIYQKLDKLYKTLKTKYGALQLSVEDVDPQLATAMTGAAREKIVDLSQRVVKKNQQQNLTSQDQAIQSQEKRLAVLNDTIKFIRNRYQIYDTKSQGELFAKQITSTYANLEGIKAQLEAAKKVGMRRDSIIKYQARLAGLESKKDYLEKKVALYNEGLLKLLQLEQQQTRMAYELSLDMERNKKLSSTYDSPFTVIHVVEKESVPIEKSRPRRSILVLAFTFLAFVLSCLWAIFHESTRTINWKDIYAG